MTVRTPLSMAETGSTVMKKRGSGLNSHMNMRFPSMCPAMVEGKLANAAPRVSFPLSSLLR